MTEQEYRAADGVNKSTLWEMRKSPAHYLYLLTHPAEDTPALRFGRAIHAALLTPSAFKRDYVVAPTLDKRTKAGREAYAEWRASLPTGTEELTAEEAQTLAEMVKSIKRDPAARELLRHTRREIPLFWNDKRTGILCKCRIDALGKDTVIDLKTTADIMSFERDAWNYGYHVQAAHYLRGAEAKTGKFLKWAFIVVEKKPPYGVKIIKGTPGFIDYGDFIRAELLDRLQECRTSGEWPSYKAGEITEPKWANWEVD